MNLLRGRQHAFGVLVRAVRGHCIIKFEVFIASLNYHRGGEKAPKKGIPLSILTDSSRKRRSRSGEGRLLSGKSSPAKNRDTATEGA